MAKTQTTSSNISIPQEWRDAFTNVYGMGQKAAAKPYEAYGDQPSDYVAQLNQQQQAGMANVDQAANSWQPGMAQAQAAATAGGQAANLGDLDIQKYMSPYVQNVADTTARQMNQQFQQAQAGQMGNAIKSGAFGGDRAGVAAANLQNQQAMAMGSTMSNIYNQGYGQAAGIAGQQQSADLAARQANLARQAGMGQQLASMAGQGQQMGLAGANAQMQAGTMAQATQQKGIDAMINNFMQQKGYDFQTAQYLANLASAFGPASGSTQTGKAPASFFGGFADGGAVGYAPGGVAGPYGATFGDGNPEAMMSYVPGAALQPAQMLQGDPNMVQNQQGTAADAAAKAASFGDSVKSLSSDYDSVSNWLKSMGKKLGGGVTGMADGGYLDTVLQGQSQKQPVQILTPHESQSSGGGGLGDLIKLGTTIAGFMNSGGRVGYDEGGVITPEDLAAKEAASREFWRTHPTPPMPTVQSDSPTLGSVPAPIRQMVRVQPSDVVTTGGLSGPAGMGSAPVAVAERPTVSPTLADAAQSRAPLTSLIPKSAPRPEIAGLGTADLAAAGIGVAPKPIEVQPMVQKGLPGVTATSVPPTLADAPPPPATGGVVGNLPKTTGNEVDPVNFFNSRILGQESGHQQYNKDGTVKTSSAGAIGIAQVMPGTAPTAAKMAGLPWDEDKYLHDADYNAALGRAYFLSQYDKYGDVAMAAAAYNAGPGNVDKAIRRAQESGGSYIDYLPAETRAYVASTTGAGPIANGVGRGVGNIASGIAREGGAAAQTLGNIINNPDGTFNKDALLSILSGIGTMASSPSRFLGTAILQGIGGGAQTYMGQEARRQEITGKQTENTSAQYDAWMKAKALDPSLANVSFQDWIKGQQYGAMPYSGGSPTGGSPAAGDWRADVNDLKTKVIDYGDGVKVNASQDRAYLQKWNQDHADQAVYNPMVKAQIDANNQMLNILPANGAIDVNGKVVPQPGVIQTADQTGLANTQIQNRDTYMETVNKTLPALNGAKQNLYQIASDYQKFDPGAMTSATSGYAAVLKAMDPNDVSGLQKMFDDPASVQIARKRAAAYIASQFNNLPGAPAAGLDVLSQMSPDADLQPEAVRQIIVQAAATIDQQKEMADAYLAAGSPRDVAGFQRNWLEKNGLQSFYDKEDKVVPVLGLRNQTKTEATPEVVSKSSVGAVVIGGDGNTYKKSQDGTWEKQ